MKTNNLMLVFGALIAVALASLLSACQGGDETGDSVAQGRRLFAANCGLCHGQAGEGKPSLGKGLMNNEFVRSSTDEDLVEFLQEGRRADHPLNERGVDMPPRGGNPGLTDEDLRQIVAYLRSLG